MTCYSVPLLFNAVVLVAVFVAFSCFFVLCADFGGVRQLCGHLSVKKNSNVTDIYEC